MKTVTTKQAIQILIKGLDLESLAPSTFTKYCKRDLVIGKVSQKREYGEPLMWIKSDIIKSINKIQKYKNQRVIYLEHKYKNKTKMPKEILRDKEPDNYAKAFNLFNLLV